MFLLSFVLSAVGYWAPVAPSDPRIVYVGRFDWTDKASPTCEWSASEVRLRVQGATFTATVDDANGCGWEIVIDGKATGVLPLKKGADTYAVNLGNDSVHEVSLVRRAEAFMGPTSFKGFEVPNGKLLKAKPRSRHIEVVGDSITCGYGNEGKDQNERFRPETENAYESYASVAARLLDADVTIIAWSGRKMWPDNTTPEIYDTILPNEGKGQYDFKGPVPSAVVINLATNDFGKSAPDEDGWTRAYETFIRRIWSHYPKAQIYAATGPMMVGDPLAKLQQYLQKISTDMNDPRLHLIDFETQKQENGLGSDWHPSVKTDEIMGAQLAGVIKRDLHW
ncbi:MAG: GDSL-type esterase/lipase family protein [Fimbriimonas sp.]|nr:GDSL-type esterase/lipase family protein [Fimbriimonas sp.]